MTYENDYSEAVFCHTCSGFVGWMRKDTLKQTAIPFMLCERCKIIYRRAHFFSPQQSAEDKTSHTMRSKP